MVLDGRQVVSQSTENNGRLLSVFCIFILISDIYQLKPTSWNVFGNSIPSEVFNGLAPIFLSGLSVSYFLHWWSDHVSFVNWFRKAEVAVGTMDKMGAVQNTEDSLSGLKRRLDWLVDQMPRIQELEKTVLVDGKELTTQQIAAGTEALSTQMRDVLDALQGIGSKFELVKGTGFVLIYVWYLAVPAALVCLAILSLAFGLVD